MSYGRYRPIINPIITIGTMNITVSPAKTRGRYNARLDDGRILGPFETPFYSVARMLLSEGVCPQEPLTMTHEGVSTVCLISTVGEAAALSLVEDPKRGFRMGRYQPSPFARPE